ncbi:hypothetical protein WG901_06525 [Novosphingobium sp. PS1R-30]|uniref:Uncharacterized protein n=1 Tax=Novosphingobium anseongense TaxID=3133436 RepID=A0ABU8RU93_9SPHN
MNSRAYRVTVTDLAKDADATRSFETTGVEVCEDGSLYLPMVLGAEIVCENDWGSVTVTKLNDRSAERLRSEPV